MIENNKFKLTKIPLEYVVQILTLLYKKGYGYFDIEGTPDDSNDEEKRDVIKISVREDYFIGDDKDEDDDNIDIDYEKLL